MSYIITRNMIEFRGSKNDIENIFDQIIDHFGNTKRLNLKSFYNLSYNKFLEKIFDWWLDSDSFSINYPKHEGDIGSITFDLENSSITDGVLELSINHPNVIFRYTLEFEDYKDESLIQNGLII